MATDDGRRGWLAEAQGFYAVNFETDAPPLDFARRATGHQNNQKQDNSFIGSALTLDNRKFKVVDTKKTTCIGSEGELPFAAPQGRQTVSVDLVGANAEFGCVEIETGSIRAFTGRYAGVERPALHQRKAIRWLVKRQRPSVARPAAAW